MAFFTSAIDTLKILVIALGAGLGAWGVINLSRKYDITKHPNYKYLSDFDEKNAFDIEKYLSTRLPVRPRELYPNYEITPEELAAQTSA